MGYQAHERGAGAGGSQRQDDSGEPRRQQKTPLRGPRRRAQRGKNHVALGIVTYPFLSKVVVRTCKG